MTIKTNKTINKSVAAKEKTVNTGSSSIKSKLNKVPDHMIRHEIFPIGDLVADGLVNICKADSPSGSLDVLYIVSPDDPFVCLYCAKDGGKVHKMVFTVADERIKTERDRKVKQFEAALSVALLGNEKTLVEHCTSGQIEVSQSAKITGVIDYETVDRLAAMTPFEYDRLRKTEALSLGIRTSTLDKAVEDMRKLSLSIKTLGPRLLSDVYNVFVTKNAANVGTNDLITALCDADNSIWSGFNRGDHISDSQIAFILKHYEVVSKDIRFGDKVFKGYAKDDISAALSSNSTISDTNTKPDENPNLEK